MKKPSKVLLFGGGLLGLGLAASISAFVAVSVLMTPQYVAPPSRSAPQPAVASPAPLAEAAAAQAPLRFAAQPGETPAGEVTEVAFAAAAPLSHAPVMDGYARELRRVLAALGECPTAAEVLAAIEAATNTWRLEDVSTSLPALAQDPAWCPSVREALLYASNLSQIALSAAAGGPAGDDGGLFFKADEPLPPGGNGPPGGGGGSGYRDEN